MQPKNDKNFAIFLILTGIILFAFQYVYLRPQQERLRHQQELAEQAKQPSQMTAPSAAALAAAPRERELVLSDSPRLPIVTDELKGSINLKGASLDDLSLLRYRESVDPNASIVVLLSPAGSAPPLNPYYAEFSWLALDPATAVPTSDTVWKTTDKKLTPDSPAHLTWDNGHGLVFTRTIAVDDHFMFTVTDSVKNNGTAPSTLYPFGLVARQGDFFIERRLLDPAIRAKYTPNSFEGPLGVLGGTLDDIAYKKLRDDNRQTFDTTGGWIGFTDKYWLIALVPTQADKLKTTFTYNGAAVPDIDTDHFQTDFRGEAMVVQPGMSVDHTTQLFAGAKHLKLLNEYSNKFNIPLFNRAIDFGWFWFLALPFTELLNYLTHTLGSAATAILVLTVMIRLITAPIMIKMFRSSARMREVMPEMKRLQERHKEDKVKMHQEVAALYKREKINPLAGCFPVLVQIPIFFALYKALSVSIELRQAPFWGWVHDMSVADPTSVFTLFGLIPWNPPQGLHIGAWPVIMGITMFIQQQLTPQPTADETQKRMFMFMPVIITYVMSSLPVGLVIYYSWSNLLSIFQQTVIMKRFAVKKLG